MHACAQVIDMSVIALDVWTKASLKEPVGLPMGVKANDKEPEAEVASEIKEKVKCLDEETLTYETTHKQLTAKHKQFCTGTLADIVKIS